MFSNIVINNNGTLQRAGDARVPAMDHGFLYGDSVYETLRTVRERPLFLERHLKRLERSLERISLQAPFERRKFEQEIERTVSGFAETSGEAPPGDLSIRIVVTRGVGPIGLDITLCHEPRFLIFAIAIPPTPDSLYEEGIGVVVSGVRRNHPSALDPGIKSGNFLNNILAYRDAREAGAQEAVLLTADGYVAECTTSNIFVVNDGVVQTPGTFGILDGITRAVIIEELRDASLGVEELRLPVESLLEADEAFISSSVRGVVPVTRIGAKAIGDGRAGPITRQVMELYAARIEREVAAARTS